MGWLFCGGALAAMAVHEGGHALVWAACRLPSSRAFVPILERHVANLDYGERAEHSKYPLWYDEDDAPLPLTPFGTGVLLLAGAFISLLVAGAIRICQVADVPMPVSFARFLTVVSLCSLLFNTANLVALFHVSDGGQISMILTAGGGTRPTTILGILGFTEAAVLFWQFDRTMCIVISILSLLYLPGHIRRTEDSACLLSSRERAMLAAIWLILICLYGALIVSDELMREILYPMICGGRG